MSVSRLHTLYAVNLNTKTLAVSPVLVDQVTDFRLSPEIREVIQAGDGDVDPTYVAVMGQSPRLRFTTTALATVLATCGIDGEIIDADGSYPGLLAWFQKLAEGGTRESGSAHLQMTVKEGLLVPRVLRASQDGSASLDLEAIATYDGTNDPVVVADSQALAGSPAVGELFTVGPVKVNGTALESIQDITVDLGIQEIIQSGDGQVWPTFVGILRRQPSITVRTTDAVSLATFGLEGSAISTTAVAYFRKLAQGGLRVAEATVEHVSVTVNDGRVSVREVSASQDSPAMSEVTITPRKGANPILVLSTATTIT